MTAKSSLPLIAICMGSQSDWSTMKAAADLLDQFGAAHEVKIISAHRTPTRLSKFAETAHENGFGVIIAGAGGAAHLAGMAAAMTHLPVIAVPVSSKHLQEWTACCRWFKCRAVSQWLAKPSVNPVLTTRDY